MVKKRQDFLWKYILLRLLLGRRFRYSFQLSKIFETVERLLRYNPAFVSITYNPEGKTKKTPIPLAAIIRQRFKVETVAHLTCIVNTREDLSKTLDVMDYFGIKNILTLRGEL